MYHFWTVRLFITILLSMWQNRCNSGPSQNSRINTFENVGISCPPGVNCSSYVGWWSVEHFSGQHRVSCLHFPVVQLPNPLLPEDENSSVVIYACMEKKKNENDKTIIFRAVHNAQETQEHISWAANFKKFSRKVDDRSNEMVQLCHTLLRLVLLSVIFKLLFLDILNFNWNTLHESIELSLTVVWFAPAWWFGRWLWSWRGTTRWSWATGW